LEITRYCFIWVRVFGILTRPRAERSGVRIPVPNTDFHRLQTVHTGTETHPGSYSTGTCHLSRRKSGPAVNLTTHLNLA